VSRRLEGKVAIVVGAGSSGADISNGAACAVLYAREGASVLCADRSLAAADDTMRRIHAEKGVASSFEADVRNAGQLAAMVRSCIERYGRIDVLHNNVGIEEFGALTEQSEESWDRVHAVNLRGPMLACREAVPHMIAQGGGSIVNISSVASRKWGPVSFLSYNSSKAALNHMTRIIARQYAPNHVRCNAILPGLIDTPHAARLTQGGPEAVQKARDVRHKRCPMGHQGTAWDVAYAALYLASDESKYVTGLELVVDGGLSL